MMIGIWTFSLEDLLLCLTGVIAENYLIYGILDPSLGIIEEVPLILISTSSVVEEEDVKILSPGPRTCLKRT